MVIVDYDASNGTYLILDSSADSVRGTSKGYAWMTKSQFGSYMNYSKFILIYNTLDSSVPPQKPIITSKSYYNEGDAALPSVLSAFGENYFIGRLIWIFSVTITASSVLELGVTLAAQQRYQYKSLPDIDKTKQVLSSLPDSCCYEEIKCAYDEKYITLMYRSIEKITTNDVTC